ncbi:hypothetical protein AB6D22_00100 [Vibrio splendidus]|nr:hypothetical protein [Vibrio splendidus]
MGYADASQFIRAFK